MISWKTKKYLPIPVLLIAGATMAASSWGMVQTATPAAYYSTSDILLPDNSNYTSDLISSFISNRFFEECSKKLLLLWPNTDSSFFEPDFLKSHTEFFYTTMYAHPSVAIKYSCEKNYPFIYSSVYTIGNTLAGILQSIFPEYEGSVAYYAFNEGTTYSPIQINSSLLAPFFLSFTIFDVSLIFIVSFEKKNFSGLLWIRYSR